MVRIDFDNKEIIHERKRYPLKPFKLFLLEHHEELCVKHRIKAWIFDWETIMFHTRKYYLINFYLNNLINETKKKT